MSLPKSYWFLIKGILIYFFNPHCITLLSLFCTNPNLSAYANASFVSIINYNMQHRLNLDLPKCTTQRRRSVKQFKTWDTIKSNATAALLSFCTPLSTWIMAMQSFALQLRLGCCTHFIKQSLHIRNRRARSLGAISSVLWIAFVRSSMKTRSIWPQFGIEGCVGGLNNS